MKLKKLKIKDSPVVVVIVGGGSGYMHDAAQAMGMGVRTWRNFGSAYDYISHSHLNA
jgi:hypothetical protein